MAKMIFNDYEDSLPVPTTGNMIAPNRYRPENSNVPMGRKNTDSTVAAVAKTVGNTVVPVISLIDSAINIIPDILNSVSAMYTERQLTLRLKDVVQAKITESREQTNQIAIMESNKTERVHIECQKELELKRIELNTLKETLLSKSKETKSGHKEFLLALSSFEGIIKSLMKTSSELTGQIKNVINNDTKLQLILTSLNITQSRLVELSKEIVNLRNGKGVSNV